MFLLGLRSVYIFFWLLTLLAAGQSSSVSATTRARYFFRNINPAYVNNTSSLTLSETQPKTNSYMKCAVRCLEALSNCTSYLHNTSTGLCVLAPSPEPLVQQLTSGEGDLYVSCNAEAGYHMHRYGTATACIAVIMTIRANYSDATVHCEELGGYLTSVRSVDKLQLLTSAMGGNSSFWVGLDDMDEEGTYVWREDGGVAFTTNENITAAAQAELMMKGLWDHPREPNNFGGNEDCVQVKYSETINSLRLNDFRCNTNNKFICEMPVKFT